MIVAEKISDVRHRVREARWRGQRIVLVPTMGALHEGHVALLRTARATSGFVVVSIFVNPLQFGPNEDFHTYPRTHAQDLLLCRREHVDLVFAPTAMELYPPDFASTVHVATLSEKMCGHARSGHFDGVCTVVAKLLAIVQPDTAWFGEKDAQQLAIVRRMVADLNLPVEIRACPIVRDADGLALSSRNVHLKAAERQQALALSAALTEARHRLDAGQRDAAALAALVRDRLAAAEGVQLEYVAVVHPDTLEDLGRIGDAVLVAVAARVGTTRLIDNVLLRGLKNAGTGD